MADQVLRYRALTRYTYARALLSLLAYARASQDDFYFGPSSPTAMETSGLEIHGADLTGVAEVLGNVPGLIKVPA